MRIYKDFTFEAAHRLTAVPPDHPCSRIHGHSYKLRVYLQGEPDADTGWIMDFGELKKIVGALLHNLDHCYLNEVRGLDNPTCERLILWIWKHLKPELPQLAKLELKETDGCGAIYENS